MIILEAGGCDCNISQRTFMPLLGMVTAFEYLQNINAADYLYEFFRIVSVITSLIYAPLICFLDV